MRNVFLLIIVSICFMSFKTVNIDGPWIVSKKGNVILYTRPINYSKVPSPDSLNIEVILLEQNESLRLINSKLGTRFDSNFSVYLYNYDEAKDKIGTNGGGFSMPKDRIIYYTYSKTKNKITGKDIYLGIHELVHLVTRSELGYAKSRLMGEGYAVALTGNYSGYKDLNGDYCKKTIEMWMTEYVTKGQILKPNDLISNEKYPETLFYPQAGFFINWLFDNYGVEKITKLYILKNKRIKRDFEKITGDKFDSMEMKYLDYCNKLK